MIDTTKKPFNEFLMENKNDLIFIIPMRRVDNILGISFTSSSTQLENVACEIDEEKYRLENNYKITLKAIDPAFGKDHFYLTDLKSSVQSGHIKMYLKIKL